MPAMDGFLFVCQLALSVVFAICGIRFALSDDPPGPGVTSGLILVGLAVVIAQSTVVP